MSDDRSASGRERSDLEGLDRCDNVFILDLHMEIIGEESPEKRPREALREKLSDEQIESVTESYLLCLPAGETVERIPGALP